MITIRNSSKDGRFLRLSFEDTPWGAIGSVISAGIGAWSTNRAAKKQLQATRETNETNLQLAREQREWDLEQWNRENDYNSAESQLQRWQKAGFSPQSFLGVGSPGEAAALQSPDMANQVPPPDMSGYAQSFAQSIQQGVKGMLDWKQLELDQKQLDMNKERLAYENANTQSQTDLNEALTEQAKANLKYIEELAKMTEEQRYKFRAETDLAVQQWEWLAKLHPVEYKEKNAKADIAEFERALYDSTMDERIESFALANNKTKAEVRLMLKQAIYWLYQGKEGEFQVTLQPLRFDLLNWQQQHAHFNLNFDKNTRYSQLRFENAMKGIHAFAELGHLVIDGLELVSPAKHIHNYIFNPSGTLP